MKYMVVTDAILLELNRFFGFMRKRGLGHENCVADLAADVLGVLTLAGCSALTPVPDGSPPHH
jgi:hypothetical protein